MSKADEIFKKLNYKKVEENIYENEIENIEYRKIIENGSFSTIIKIIEIFNPKFYVKPFINLVAINKNIMQKDSFDLSLKELQAINKKCREMGWLDE